MGDITHSHSDGKTRLSSFRMNVRNLIRFREFSPSCHSHESGNPVFNYGSPIKEFGDDRKGGYPIDLPVKPGGRE
jgi:hypothetical protein